MLTESSKSHNIYNKETGEKYSIEYFLNHVNPNLDYSKYNYLVEDHIVNKSCRRVYHTDTYLYSNVWRVQIAVARCTKGGLNKDFIRWINTIQASPYYQPQLNRALCDEEYNHYFGMTLCFEIPYVEKRE